MAEYINREELITACKKTHFAVNANDHPFDVAARVGKYFRRCVDEAPAADVVEVVRCKDCKEWKRNVGLTDSPNGHCFCHNIDTNGLDFCSYGERKERE